MPTSIEALGLKFTLAEPPEPFADDFPMVSEYYLISTEQYNPFIWVPEDGELLKGDAALAFIYRCAPLTSFVGAVQVTVNLPRSSPQPSSTGPTSALRSASTFGVRTLSWPTRNWSPKPGSACGPASPWATATSASESSTS